MSWHFKISYLCNMNQRIHIANLGFAVPNVSFRVANESFTRANVSFSSAKWEGTYSSSLLTIQNLLEVMSLKFQLIQLRNPKVAGEKLWYGSVKHEQPTMELDDLSEHMSKHNSPFSKGLIKGILTDMVACIKEMVLQGRKVKINDLAIFSLKVKSKGESDPKEWTVAKNITNVHLNARATGEFTIDNLKGATLVESPDYVSPRRAEETPATPEDPGTGGSGL